MSKALLETGATLLLMPSSTEALTFGRRLQEIRKKRGLSQKELGAAVGVHYIQVSKYETGVNFPTVGKVLQIARTLQVSLDQLFGEVVPDEAHVKNLRLLRRFRELEQLPKDDQETAIKLVDALIAQGKIRKIVG
ncbi:MAG: helix-turn-helix transcriptional regulator [Holophagales bacterium]|nr:helix-turn-helix transcriptional regulator [Holophagales bacterium]MBK9373725.1 helix-turn-helix transcriptional regulator [Holophagales bacterium]